MSKSVNIGDVYCFPNNFYKTGVIKSCTTMWIQISTDTCMILYEDFGGIVNQHANRIPNECIVLFNLRSLIKDHIVPKL